jgi:hypothetical protein
MNSISPGNFILLFQVKPQDCFSSSSSYLGWLCESGWLASQWYYAVRELGT